MSTLVTESIKRPTETASRSARGVAAAFLNLNGTGTIAARDSQNVSSVTDGGVGTYSAGFTNAFDAADYTPIAWCQFISGNTLFVHQSFADVPATTSLKFLVGIVSLASSFDSPYIWNAIHGDLA